MMATKKVYHVQIAETYRTGYEASTLSLINHINAETLIHHDSEALVPAIDKTKRMEFTTKQMLVDPA